MAGDRVQQSKAHSLNARLASRRAFALIGAVAVALPAAMPAQAQVAPPVNVAPSRAQIQAPPVAAQPAPNVSVDSNNAITAPACALATSPLRVAIDHVRYTPLGRDSIAPGITAALAGVALPVKGDQPISGVCAIRDAANAALRRAGYVASVQIPPQEITNGELVLAVIVARITEIRVRGEAGPHRAALDKRIAEIRALDPVNERDIERLLLLAGDIPGLDVQLSLRPAGTAPGDVIGDLTLTSQKFALYGNVQNYGSAQLGRETAYLRAETYGVLTSSDLLYVAGSTTLDFKEQQVAQLGYTTWLTDSGMTLGVRGVYAWSRPTLDQLDLRSRSIIAGIDLAQPLIRSVKTNLTLTGGFELLEQRTKVYGGPTPSPLNRDKLRVLYARIDGGYRQPRPQGGDVFYIHAGIELRKGIDVLDASKAGAGASDDGYTLSRFDGDPLATVVRGDADVSVGLGPIFSLAGAARGQWANHALLNLEEYSIGNLTIGRGYDPGSNSGDRVIGLRGEVRARLPLQLPVAISLLGFFDSIWLYNLDRNSTEESRRLTSWGGGAEVQLPGKLLFQVLYAKPRDKALTFDKAPPPARVLVSLTGKFGPNAR